SSRSCCTRASCCERPMGGRRRRRPMRICGSGRQASPRPSSPYRSGTPINRRPPPELNASQQGLRECHPERTKRACERSPRACPARSEPASGAHGFLLRMTRNAGTPGKLLDASRSCSHVRPRPLNDGDQSYFTAPLLKIFVPQTGQAPSVAGRPFFIVSCLAFLISRWALLFIL